MKKQAALIVLLVMLVQYILPVSKVFAVGDPLTDVEMRFYRMKTSQAANATTARILVKFNPGTTSTQNEVRVTFAGSGTGGAATYTVDSTAGNITVSTTSLPAGCTAAPGIGSAANAVSGAAVDFTVTDLTETTEYCFYITGGITNITSAGSVTNTVSMLSGSNVVGESSDVTVQHIADDQVVISATVPPTFTFALGANTTSFTANLSSSATISTTGVTGTIGTNANNGWSAYLRSTNAALSSAIASSTIATSGTVDGTPTTISNGSNYYQLDVDETADPNTNGSIQAEYNGSSTQGGTFNSADLEQIASGTGVTSGYVFTLVGKAAITATQKAASDYTDTWTVVASGNF
ncbi:MAG: hypothetical protein KBC15_03015 [Candidatus Levybacteria bacterium]|nr:hypothetical protein [Candidatus Levybacteria bacterium]